MSILLQLVEGGNAVADTTASGGGGAMDILGLIWKGGVVMIPIGILSVIAVYLTFERYFTIKKAGVLDSQFMSDIKEMVQGGDLKSAQRLCHDKGTPIGLMIEKGLSRIGKPLKDISVAVENVGKLEVYKLEKGMAILATISGAAPMLGFLGTVTGMIRTFNQMQDSGQQITADLLSGGIGEAMMTTVAGLVVGIFAYISYNLLSNMVNKVVYKMEATSVEFLDIMHEPA
ncbi:MAG: MotA/TolQ/ExbB proton channel family protein [Bacteroidetes bacterium]|jgi:biopolymer transport protein ExbB|nr:MotA/TolQ/ExbB proton channel family protein [Bacteroidota bacterium]MDA8930862.1 MotA/TolQ/ExbB proton channel family protein [Bacteroidia bacterium]